MTPRLTVCVVAEWIAQYNVPFYELLRASLKHEGVVLRLVHGQPGPNQATRGDTASLPWAVGIQNRHLPFGARQLVWQPCLRYLKGCDLVIVEQASKLLVNYVLLARHALGLRPRLAFWGHGVNFQNHKASRVGETIKRFCTRRAHWFFAHTEGSARVVEGCGFARERITVVQNAIDTTVLVRAHRELVPADLEGLRQELGLEGRNVGLFIGAMYAERRLPFLVEAARRIRELVPDFELLLIGAGPDAHVAVSAAEALPWVRYRGARFDQDKVPYFALSKLVLMPGIVGLVIVDSFALETPMVTSAVEGHGPEIAYLEDGGNGLMVRDAGSVEAYAQAVAGLLENEELRQRLMKGCRLARGRYTMEEMVRRFGEGILEALNTPIGGHSAHGRA